MTESIFKYNTGFLSKISNNALLKYFSSLTHLNADISLKSKLLFLFKYINHKNVLYHKTLNSIILKLRLNNKSDRKFNTFCGIYYHKLTFFQCFIHRNKKSVYITLNNVTATINLIKISTERKLKENIFSKISHELKTPAIILMQLNNQTLSYLEENKQKEAIQSCNLSVTMSIYISNLIKEFIQLFSSNFLISLQVNRKRIVLQPLLEETFNILNCLIYANSSTDLISCFLTISEEVKNYEFISDYDIVFQILILILSNSVKFTRKGSIEISSGLENIKEKDYFFISIKDTGCGISNQIIKNFENTNELDELSFDEYTYNQSSGLGIGLKLIKALSRKINALVFIDSSINGTEVKLCFSVEYFHKDQQKVELWNDDYFDLSEVSDLSQNETVKLDDDFPQINPIFINNIYKALNEKIDSEESEFPLTLKKESKFLMKSSFNLFKFNQRNEMSIASYAFTLPLYINENNKEVFIICDDYSIIRQSHKVILNNVIGDKYQVIECKDGIEFIKIVYDCKYRKQRIRAAFIDENMETMNGSEAISIIKHLINNNKIDNFPSFSVTAFDDDETKRKILSKGADKILSKPLKMQELRTLLLQHNLI